MTSRFIVRTRPSCAESELAVIHDASLGDRFAMATAQINKSRLYTTDPTLRKYCRQRKVPVTYF